MLAIRSERDSLFTLGLWSNKPLSAAVALTFGLQLATIYVPSLREVFKTQRLGVSELLATIAVASVVFLAVEVEKWLQRRSSPDQAVVMATLRTPSR